MNIYETIIYGVVSGVIASVLTLIGEKVLKNIAIRHRLSKWEGNYNIIHNSLGKDTSTEKVTIKYKSGYQFDIVARFGPCGDWEGSFYVDPSCENLAHGAYRYSGRLDWGHHELLFNDLDNQIYVYGINRSKPGTAIPFSTAYGRN